MSAWKYNEEPWLVWITHDINNPALNNWTTTAITAASRDEALDKATDFVKELRMRVRSVDLRKANGGLPGDHHDSIKCIRRKKGEKKSDFVKRIETLRTGGKDPRVMESAWIEGDTYPHRQAIKATGARWRHSIRSWGWQGESLSEIEHLKDLGLTIIPIYR